MGWLMLVVTISAVIFSIIHLKKRPMFLIVLTVLISFSAFYYIGKFEYDSVFIFAAILYSVIVYALIVNINQKNPQ